MYSTEGFFKKRKTENEKKARANFILCGGNREIKRGLFISLSKNSSNIHVSPPRQLHAHDPLPPRQADPPPGPAGQEAIDLEDGGVRQGEGLQAGVLGGEG